LGQPGFPIISMGVSGNEIALDAGNSLSIGRSHRKLTSVGGFRVNIDKVSDLTGGAGCPAGCFCGFDGGFSHSRRLIIQNGGNQIAFSHPGDILDSSSGCDCF
jgi:hypothetical protein